MFKNGKSLTHIIVRYGGSNQGGRPTIKDLVYITDGILVPIRELKVNLEAIITQKDLYKWPGPQTY